MSCVVDSKLNVAVSDAQVEAFKTWAKERYENYNNYKTGMRRDNSVEVYVRSNILPQEMKSVWREAEPYTKVVSDDLRIKRLMLYRRRIQNKVRYMSVHLGELTYEEEVAEERRQKRERVRQQREEEERQRIRMEEMEVFRQQEGVIVVDIPLRGVEGVPRTIMKGVTTYKKKQLTSEELKEPMKEDCSICMEKHDMCSVIEGPCGHQFGKSCFERWVNNSRYIVKCPLCRGDCTEVCEYVA